MKIIIVFEILLTHNYFINERNITHDVVLFATIPTSAKKISDNKNGGDTENPIRHCGFLLSVFGPI